MQRGTGQRVVERRWKMGVRDVLRTQWKPVTPLFWTILFSTMLGLLMSSHARAAQIGHEVAWDNLTPTDELSPGPTIAVPSSLASPSSSSSSGDAARLVPSKLYTVVYRTSGTVDDWMGQATTWPTTEAYRVPISTDFGTAMETTLWFTTDGEVLRHASSDVGTLSPHGGGGDDDDDDVSSRVAAGVEAYYITLASLGALVILVSTIILAGLCVGRCTRTKRETMKLHSSQWRTKSWRTKIREQLQRFQHRISGRRHSAVNLGDDITL